MKLLQTNNGRLRIDPSSVLAIELEPIGCEPIANPHAIITLERGVEVSASKEEAVELAIQWEAYMAELDPGDDEDDDDDDQDDDDDLVEIPITIDIVPESKKLRRRQTHG